MVLGVIIIKKFRLLTLMRKIGDIEGYCVFSLDEDATKKYLKEIVELVKQIPKVTITEEELLASSKGDRIYYGKNEYSLIVFDEELPVAVLIAYERSKENNEQYPKNTIYISQLAVVSDYQGKGIATKLLKLFFERNERDSLKYLEGELNYSVQTNSAEWNKHVQDLYKKFGFTKRAMKSYENRVDVVLGK